MEDEQAVNDAAELLAHGFGAGEAAAGSDAGAARSRRASTVRPSPPLPQVQPAESAAHTHSGEDTSGGGGGGGGAGPSHSQSQSARERASSLTRGRAARAALADPSLHPVLRLGWRTLCRVTCNGLTGDFLGGHDRDLWVRCTARPYAGLPPIDVTQGGCIMTCSQFEKAAGRELSKKWKESLHVVGPHEGSAATLAAWLRRRAERDYGAGIVGQAVWVCWCANADYYQGTIVGYSSETGKHRVRYSERFSEDLHLPAELVSFAAAKPALPPVPAVGQVLGPLSAPAPAASQQAPGQAPRDSPAPAFTFPLQPLHEDMRPVNPLWHQGSGISVTSSYVDELKAGVGGRTTSLAAAVAAALGGDADLGGGKAAAAAAAAAAAKPAAGAGGGLRRRGMLSRVSEEGRLPGGGEGGAVKRCRATTAAEVLREAAAIAAEQEGLLAVATPPAALPSGADLHPGRPPPRQQAAQCALPEPPPAAVAEASLDAVSAWMHSTALALDGDLAAAAGDGGGPSLSARFQALLALARREEAWLRGLYEGMAARRAHFGGDAALLRLKLAEFVEGVLHESGVIHDLRPPPPISAVLSGDS